MLIINLKAAQKWSKIPNEIQDKLLGNVFCGKCGVKTVTDYSMTNYKYGVLMEGK